MEQGLPSVCAVLGSSTVRHQKHKEEEEEREGGGEGEEGEEVINNKKTSKHRVQPRQQTPRVKTFAMFPTPCYV